MTDEIRGSFIVVAESDDALVIRHPLANLRLHQSETAWWYLTETDEWGNERAGADLMYEPVTEPDVALIRAFAAAVHLVATRNRNLKTGQLRPWEGGSK